jgi:hypothetical protein
LQLTIFQAFEQIFTLRPAQDPVRSGNSLQDEEEEIEELLSNGAAFGFRNLGSFGTDHRSAQYNIRREIHIVGYEPLLG